MGIQRPRRDWVFHVKNEKRGRSVRVSGSALYFADRIGRAECQKKPKPKQQRRREPEALDEQEVREGTRRGLKKPERGLEPSNSRFPADRATI